MFHTTPISSLRRPSASPAPPPDAERIAQASLSLFLDAILVPEPTSNSLAVALFAHGAVDGIARTNNLTLHARERLERALLSKLAGSRRQGISGWRQTLHDLENTPRGHGLRLRGEEAVHAWLAGEPPLRFLQAAMASPGS